MRAHLQEAPIVLASPAHEDRLNRRLHVVVDAAPAHAAIELERLVVGVEHQLLGLAEVSAHERHPAVRQLHVRRFDGQRQTLQGDRFVAPVELVGLARGKAHRHKRPRRNPCPFLPPRLDEAVHTVVRTVIAAPTQLLEQPLRRPPLAPWQSGFLLEHLVENRHPLTELRHWLHAASVSELGLPAAVHSPNGRPRHRKPPHDLLDRQTLLKIGATDPADQIHTDHPPPTPFPATEGQRKGRLTERQRGSVLDAKTPLRGSILQANSHPTQQRPRRFKSSPASNYSH